MQAHARRIRKDVQLVEAQTALRTSAAETSQLARDISDILKNRIEDTTRQLEAVAEIIPDALIMTDENDLIVKINQAGEEIFEYQAGELQGTPSGQLFGYESTEIKKRGSENCSCRVGVTKSGRRFVVDVSTRVVENSTSKVKIILIRDITNFIKEEAETFECLDKTVLQETPDPIVRIDETLHIICANDAFRKAFGDILNLDKLILRKDRMKLYNRLVDSHHRSQLVKVTMEDRLVEWNILGSHHNGRREYQLSGRLLPVEQVQVEPSPISRPRLAASQWSPTQSL